MGQSSDRAVLDPQDLIADDEIRSADNDRLAHERIAAQLAALAISVPPQSNIALYGSWGSGKSSVANLLRAKLTTHHTGRWGRTNPIRFARFDAFKYAETPLRRNFITAVARELEIYDYKFHDGLYATKTETKIDMSLRQQGRVLRTFLMLLAVVIVVGAAAAALMAALRDGPWWNNFTTLADKIAIAGLLPATLVTGLASLASKPFQVERKTEQPESDEQFEQLFTALVTESGAQRLVVFVDELDRCSASTVATTLDTIRTFFRAEKCVFIVAADRRVLEEALTRAEDTQQTPADTVNPYYSTGSAYLDKVFQYQLSLPPLLPHRITQFALDLVEDRGGLWAQINLAYVVSVLVPTHVTSPRRVKHLLNTFALTYRTAQDRHRQKLLAEDPRDNAAALAKLVCLGVEFPLFARDLEVDARLPQYVLQLADNDSAQKPDSATSTAWELAREYARGSAAPALVIAPEPASDTPEQDKTESTVTAVSKAHTKQLIDYLTRTRAIPGPSRDLVFLHSPGTAFGLDGELALTIEQAADNGLIDEIGGRIAALSETQQHAVVKLLLQQITSGIGVGVTNTARTLLTLIGLYPSLPVHDVADAACAAVNHAMVASTDLLDDKTVAAAWSLATQGTESESIALRRRILATVTDDSWEYGAGFVLSDPAPALEADPNALGQLVSDEVLGYDAATAVRRLGALGDEVLCRVLTVARAPIQTQLQQDLAARDAWEKTSSEATPTDEPFDPRPSARALAELAEARGHTSPAISHDVWSLLLACDHQSTRGAVERTLTSVEATTDPDLIGLLLDAARRRRITSRPNWYAAIDPTAVTTRHHSAVSANFTQLWTDTAAVQAADVEAVDAAVAALSPLIEVAASTSAFDLTATISTEVAAAFTDISQAARRHELLKRTAPFVAAGTVDQSRLGRELTTAVTEALRQGWPMGAGEDDFLALLNGPTTQLVTAVIDIDAECVHDLIGAVKTCTWLSEPRRTGTQLALIDAARFAGKYLEAAPSATEISALLSTHGLGAVEVCARWFTVMRPPFADADLVIDTLIEHALLTRELADAVTPVRNGWSAGDQLKLLTKHLAAHDKPMPSLIEVELLGLSHLDDNTTAQLLVGRFNACTSNSQRRTVTTLLKAAVITDERARRILYDDIVLVLLRPDHRGTTIKGQVELALDTLVILGAPVPQGIKARLAAALNNAIADDNKLAGKAEPIARSLGYTPRHVGFLRRRTRME